MRINWENVRVAVYSAGRVRCEPGWSLSARWAKALNDFDLWFVWAGRGRMVLSDHPIDLRPGICIWARPGRRYEAEQDPRDRLGVSFIHFDLFDRWQPDRRITAPLPPEVNDVPDVALLDALMRQIVALHRRTGPSFGGGAAVETAHALMRAALIYLDHESSRRPSPTVVAGRRRQQALALAARIDEDPRATPSIAALAAQAGYSEGHFTRWFQSFTGQSPQAYRLRARLNRARQLLRESELSIGQIAEALGYRDVYFFSRQFRQKIGQTARAYRRSAQT